MALIKLKKSIIRGLNLSSFHGLDFIRVLQEKSHAQAKNLSSCHGTKNIQVFYKNRTISGKICLLTPILQGGIALFAVFVSWFRFSRKIARNRKKCVALPDLRRRLGFPRKSLIYLEDLTRFHGMVRDRRILEKPHDSSCELMSSSYVGLKYYELKENEGSEMLNKYTISPIRINLWK